MFHMHLFHWYINSLNCNIIIYREAYGERLEIEKIKNTQKNFRRKHEDMTDE